MGVILSGKKRYEGVRFNVISVTRGWVGGPISRKKRYVTLEWPLRPITSPFDRAMYLLVQLCVLPDLVLAV